MLTLGEGILWCPGCNRTRTLDHFTPLRLGVPYYRPYCNQCAPPSPHQRMGWVHLLIENGWALFHKLAERVQTRSDSNKAGYVATSAERRVDWSVQPAPDARTFVRLGDGLRLDLSSSDAERLLVCLQSCGITFKQHGENTPDEQQEMRQERRRHPFSGSREPDASVLAVLEPIQHSEIRETNRCQRVG